ncbi:ankyrin repeat domain-containing protein 13C-like [Tubulanus polymorphus]|uniref:ankyrin repeat domain-containing protein 13C-like n=1 Tax=Tubulanus polymorphus TaxID=672921 RepID=UPI003DA1C9D6
MEELDYSLHEAVFKGDIPRVSQLIRSRDCSKKDKHGNTPLHLAVALGHKECVLLLLAHGAPVKVKNAKGWNPLAEAISYGDRQTITSLLRKLKQQSRETLEARRPALIKALKDLGDFYLELRWDFHSWVPLVSRILPSDICKIHKKGSSIRLDTTLVDFNDMRWERGDITFIFNGEAKPNNSLTVLDNKVRCYQKIRNEESESEIEDEVDILMSSDIVAAQMPTKNISFTRAQKGFIFRADKTEMVGAFQADFYAVHGMTLDTRKRREHLSEEDLQKNKALMESLSKGTIIENCDIQRRPSLIAPMGCKLTWEQYLQAPAGHPPYLGRKPHLKHTSKHFKATLAMSQDFPMTVEVLLDVLEVIAPFKHFNKLREFMTNKLPPGFPVKIEIPVFPTVSAKITFQVFDYRDNISDSLFKIPSDYHEDPNRFPDL